MSKKILTLNKISPVGLEKFTADYTYGDDLQQPDAIMVRSAAMHDMELDAATLAVARCGAGTNNIPSDVYAKKGVVVFNTPGANANGVKELVICALLLASRKIVAGAKWCEGLKGQGDAVPKAVEKGKSAFVGPEIKGKTLGVVGLGAIGRLVADAAKALGMDIVAYDPYFKGESEHKIVTELDEIFKAGDYITLHVPATAETKGLINADSIAKMKDGVRIVNFARGELVNSDDLIAALKSGKVAAYATDFANDALLCEEGVIALPHLGASTPESEDNCAVMAAEQLMDYIECGIIRNSVNLPIAPLGKDFDARTCVICTAEAAGKVKELLGETVFDGERNGMAYIVADIKADTDKIAAVDGVVRVRSL